MERISRNFLCFLCQVDWIQREQPPNRHCGGGGRQLYQHPRLVLAASRLSQAVNAAIHHCLTTAVHFDT